MTHDAMLRLIRRVSKLAALLATTSLAGPVFGQTALTVTEIGYDANLRVQCTAVRMDPSTFGTPLASPCVPGTSSLGADRVTKNEYDAAGQLVQVRRAVGTPDEQAEVTYSYTSTGLKEDIIDANGNRARLAYDAFDRQVGWYFPSPVRPANFASTNAASARTNAGSFNAADAETYELDANGNRTVLHKRDGRTLNFTLDAYGRIVSKVISACPVGGNCIEVPADSRRSVYYAYDLNGLEISARFDGAGGADAVLTDYDALGRIKSSTSAMGGVSRTLQYSYDPAGNRTRITHPDGVYFASSYDAMNRLKHSDWWSPAAGTTPFLDITYNDKGLRYQSTLASSSTTYGYDDLSRVRSQVHQFGGGAGNLTAGFEYNAAGQVVKESKDNAEYVYSNYRPDPLNYSANGLNQYTNVAGAVYAYDGNGNLRSDGGIAYTYDAENRLIFTVGSTLSASLVYDPHGRLYQTSGGSAGITRFLYDGDALVAEYGSSGAILRRYMHGPGVDEPLLWNEGSAMDCSGTKFLHSDRQGSIIALSNCSGARTGFQNYDEYGAPSDETSAGPQNTGRFQYTGQAWIPELGLYYYKARMYSPRLGRFMQTDPIGYEDQFNLYAYVGNSPISRRDPTGQFEIGDRFDTPLEAARDAIQSRSAQARQDQTEIGGRIRIDGNGKYYATDTNIERTPHSNKLEKLQKDDRGDWHIHLPIMVIAGIEIVAPTGNDGCGFSRSCGEDFSDGVDKNGNPIGDKISSVSAASALRAMGVNDPYKSYLGTPSGKVRVFDPQTGQTTSGDPTPPLAPPKKNIYGPVLR